MFDVFCIEPKYGFATEKAAVAYAEQFESAEVVNDEGLQVWVMWPAPRWA